MSDSRFPREIRRLPAYDGPFSAHRLAAEGCDVLFATYAAGTQINAHRHETNNVGVVLIGGLYLTVNDVESSFAPGQWYHLFPEEEHAARFDEHTELIEFWFHEQPINSYDARPEIRYATGDDAPAIADLLNEAFSEFRTLYTDDAFAATVPGREVIRDRLSAGRSWVAIRGPRVVGTVSATIERDMVRLHSLAVAPAERRHGLGRFLVDEVIRFAAGRGALTLTLETTPFLDHAWRLYDAMGFGPDEPPTGDLEGTPLVRLRRSVRRDPN